MTRPLSIAVFGGTGFLGRRLITALLARGHNVTVPSRQTTPALPWMTAGLPGQLVQIPCQPRSDSAVADALSGQDMVINLIGTLTQTRQASYQTTHVEIAARLARLAKNQGIQRFMHVSALGASLHAKARYARSKAIGEEAVRAFFPESVIIRPGLLFGHQDHFLTQLAFWSRFTPFLIVFDDGATRLQPVYVEDVAQTMALITDTDRFNGRCFELVGPHIYSFRDLITLTLDAMGRQRPLLSLPYGAAYALARGLSFLPHPPLTADLVDLLRIDNIRIREQVPDKLTPETLGFEELDRVPLALPMILPDMIRAFRPAHPRD